MTGILRKQGRDTVELGRDEARAAAERLYFESVPARSVEQRVPGFRICIERHVRNVASKKVRWQSEINRRWRGAVVHEGLIRLTELRTEDAELIKRQREEHTDSAASADRKDAAGDRILTQGIAQRHE